MSSQMWRLLALLACACLMPALAMAQCGTTPCNPASKHPLDWFIQSDGMGSGNTLTNVTDVAGALVGACPLYARAHSNVATTARFDVCIPKLPIPADTAGGTSASFSITGTITVVQNSNGLVVDGGSGEWGLGQGGCTDSLNQNLPTVGTDGQCYCPPEFIWSKAKHACRPPIDRYLGGGPPNACPAGQPIYPLTGAKILNEPLLGGPLSLTAHYDTRRQLPVDDPNLMFDMSEAASFGPLWGSSLHKRVQRQTDANGLTQAVQASRGNGDWISFMRDGAGNYAAAAAEVRDRLFPSGAGWLCIDAAANAQELYDSHGNLQTVTRADGSRLAYEYSSADTPAVIAPRAELILKVSDAQGHAIQFQYDASSRIKQVVDVAGQSWTFSYDNQGQLAQINGPIGTRQYLHERGDLPWAITGIIDENGHRLATYAYDDRGRANDTQWAGGAYHHHIAYTTPPQWMVTETYDSALGTVRRDHQWTPPEGTVITQPNGSTVEVGAGLVNGRPGELTRSQPAGAGCMASTSSVGHDANGNIARRDDFNGTRSCYLNDLTRNLQVASVSGVSQGQACAAVTPANAALPSGARKTSTQWHPDWSLPIKVAEPNQITTSVYNGQPDPLNGNAIAGCAQTAATLLDGKPIAVLCKQAVQATTDADGHLGFGATLQAGVAIRVSTWTYNESGQVLTTKTTRGGVTLTTSSSYFADTDDNHTKGDVATTTDAAGKVTTYDKYTRAGQLLQSTDPDGVVTVNTYDLRQRLLTTTVGGETTTYGYDPVGQLILVTQHDGSWIAYEYDDAHRQKAVSDDSGNRIEYALDNAGNSTGQTVKDPTGSLKRNMARVMDALGRAQENSGRE